MPNGKRLEQIWGLAALFLVLVGCSGRGVEPAIIRQTTQATVPAVTPTPVVQGTPIDDGLQITKYPGNYTSFKLETSQGVILITDP
jgi:hypothetical protein